MALEPKKYSELSAASALTGAEVVPCIQSGASRRTTTQAIADLAPAGPAGPEGPEGPQGPQGIQGVPGNAGANGADGIGAFAFLAPAGHFYTQAINASALATIAGAANRIDLAPFLPTKSFTCDQIALFVTTLIAAAQGKVVIYSSDASGRPDALILETGTFDFSATGTKTVSVTQAFTAGTLYWIGVRHSSTATLRGIPVAGLLSLGVAIASATAINTMMRRTLTFATAAPSSWVFSAAEIVSAIHPTVFMRST